MDTEKTRPHITLIKIDPLVDHYEVRPGKNKRDFLDETRDKHGYVCQPMSTAGFHGWEFVLPHDVKVIWDGITNEEPHHVQILEGEYINGCKLIDTGTANGTISFNIGYMIETDPDHHILMSGAPNTFIDGIMPMNAILQTDWYHWNIAQFCWKFTKANEVITIPKGTPFLFIQNYPKNLLESTNFSIRNGSQEEHEAIDKYNKLRDSYRQNQAMDWKWHQLYKRGMDFDENPHIDKPYKPKPTTPVDLRNHKSSAPRLIKRKQMVCPVTGRSL